MSSVSRLFGTSGTAVRNRGTTSAIIYKGTIDDATVVTLTLEPGSIYYLFTAEYNATSFAFRGCRSVMIKAPEDDLFGTVAVAHGADYSSQNSGVTIGYPDDSTVTIARASATYAVKFVLMAIGTNIGNPSSLVSEAETARDQAQIYANQAAAAASDAESAATAAEGAAEHYPYIDSTTGNWMVWDAVNSVWLDTGIHAQGAQGIQGEKGDTGVSIESVTKASGTGAAGTTDTYNVNLDDQTVAGQFTVYNGADGQGSPGTQLPLPDGTASAGTAKAYAREDHVHPHDTSRGQAVLLGTDTSGNTSQTNFELSDSIQNYSSIFVLILFNWSNTSNITYGASAQVPVPVFQNFTDYFINVYRQVSNGSNSYEISLGLKYVDDTHIYLNKTRSTYSFRTLWIYGIR